MIKICVVRHLFGMGDTFDYKYNLYDCRTMYDRVPVW